MKLLLLLPLLAILFQQCVAYRILAIIPFAGKSHYILTQSIVKELAVRGHHVTVVTTFSEKNPPATYKEVIVDKKEIWDFMGEAPDIYALEAVTLEDMLSLVWNGVQFTTQTAFNSTTLQDFIDNDNSHFDLIFAEVFYQESMYMFSYKYKAPIIGISTMGFQQSIGAAQGNPLVVPYMTHEFLNFGKKLTFCERVKNLYSTTYDLFWRHFYLFPMHQKMAEKHFKKLPQPLPQLEDIERNNVSMVFINTHFSYDLVRPYVPSILEIGGVHIKPAKKLPENLQKFLDEAKDGAIYFSFGTNVKSKDMPKEKVAIFLNVFKQLKQRVIWKWEDDKLADKPANVLIAKWLPQNDILAHPNVKLFITHGGLLSTQETIYHGVPIVGFPFYGDQFLNMQKVEQIGYGIKMSFSKLTEKTFTTTLKEVLTNPKYINKVTDLSVRFKDRPNSAMDSAIYWIEYVIRHKGAPFMKSPIADLNWFEFHMIDIAALIIVSVILALLILFLLVRTVCKLTKSSQSNTKLQSKKRQ